MKFPLKNNVSWKNIFIPNKNKIMNAVDLFSKDKLKMKKIVFLLCGKPGTGKTSFVKALANETKRNVINIKLSMLEDDMQLMDVMFNPTIYSKNDKDIIPISDRIYLLEDIDAESKIVLSRKEEPDKKDELPKNEPPMILKKDDSEDDETDIKKKYFRQKTLTLSGLLNCLDGVIELYHGIVIMTTNHPEKLDEALIREGRVTIRLELENIKKPELLEMLKYHFPNDCINMDKFNRIEDNKFSPAKVENICQMNWDKDVNYIIDCLLK